MLGKANTKMLSYTYVNMSTSASTFRWYWQLAAASLRQCLQQECRKRVRRKWSYRMLALQLSKQLQSLPTLQISD